MGKIATWMTHTHQTLESVSAGMFFYEPRTHLLLLTDPARECCDLEAGYMDVGDFANSFIDETTAQTIFKSIVDFSDDCDQVLCEGQLKNGRWMRLSMSHKGSTARFVNGFLEDITVLKEVEAKSARRSEIIESLSSEYFALYLINYKTNTMVPYLLRNDVAQYFASLIGEDDSYTGWLERYCGEHIVKADRRNVYSHLEPTSIADYLDERNGDFSISCRHQYQKA